MKCLIVTVLCLLIVSIVSAKLDVESDRIYRLVKRAPAPDGEVKLNADGEGKPDCKKLEEELGKCTNKEDPKCKKLDDDLKACKGPDGQPPPLPPLPVPPPQGDKDQKKGGGIPVVGDLLGGGLGGLGRK